MNNGAFGENLPYANFHDLNLDWIIREIKTVIKDEADQNEKIEQLTQSINKLEEWVNNYDPTFIQQTVREYLQSILASMIFVEITDSGYFVYHIPEGWESIVFNTTGLDIELELQPQYGHLVLSY